jgi:hypothetical protein
MSGDHVFSGRGAYIADTGLFIACGRPTNSKYLALAAFAERIDVVFTIPRRVHEELGGSPDGYSISNAPVDHAIEQGWVEVFPELDYTRGAVSQVLDDVREYIAGKSNRYPDRTEKADTALGGVALQILERDGIERVFVVTTDVDPGHGVVRALTAQGYGDQVEFVDGFEFVDDLDSSDYREI